MKHSILVRHITHLTDARYFAAMGVDWISMRLDADPKSFMRWHSIKEWVEGLKLMAEVASGDEELLARVIIDARPDGIILPEGVDFEVPEGMVLFKEGYAHRGNEIGIVRYDGADPLPTDPLPPIKGEKIFLEAEWTLELIKQVQAAGYAGGFCFYGGEEEVIGVRDYGGMDEIIEWVKG
jgi:hypothetical protein